MKILVEASQAIMHLYNLVHGLDEAIEKALDELAQFTQQKASELTKGKLAKSIKIKKENKSREIYPDKPYARFVEYGRGPVHAKKAKYLTFKIGNKWVRTKSVGAAKPQPFMMPAGALMQKEIQRVVTRNINELNGRMSGGE
jgi:hypothetical protein